MAANNYRKLHHVIAVDETRYRKPTQNLLEPACFCIIMVHFEGDFISSRKESCTDAYIFIHLIHFD
jgi:hypothetical protein